MLTRNQWRDAIWASDLPPLPRLAALCFADHMEPEPGDEVWVSVDRGMERTRMGRSAWYDAVRDLVDDGWLIVTEPGKRGRAARAARHRPTIPGVIVRETDQYRVPDEGGESGAISPRDAAISPPGGLDKSARQHGTPTGTPTGTPAPLSSAADAADVNSDLPAIRDCLPPVSAIRTLDDDELRDLHAWLDCVDQPGIDAAWGQVGDMYGDEPTNRQLDDAPAEALRVYVQNLPPRQAPTTEPPSLRPGVDAHCSHSDPWTTDTAAPNERSHAV